MSGFRTQGIRIAGIAAVVLALVATACGKSGGASSGSTTTGGGTTTASGGGGATVKAQNVNGLGMVLVDARGFTLYHLEGETTSSLKCTGSCTGTWPPLTGAPSGGSGASGKLATFKRSDDGTTQVTYDGLPLYTYSGDSGPGQSNGEGIEGVWFAVTPAGQSAKGSGGPSPTGSSGGRYGY